MTGVVGALGVAALLLLAPQLLQRLPYSALAAVVIASVIGLIEWRDLQRIRRIQAWEFWLSIGCSAGVLLLGAIQGIVLAIVVAVIEFLWDGWRPHSAVLGRVDGIDGWHDIQRHPEAQRIDGLVLLRWDAPLFFANAEWFERVVRDTRGRGADAGAVAGGGRRAGHQHRHHGRRRAARAGPVAAASRASSCASPR